MKGRVGLRALLLVAVLAGACERGAVDATATAPAAPVASEPVTASDSPPAVPAAVPATVPATGRLEQATFASGCFWCTESDFDKVAGVVSTVSGYTGGRVVNPTYQQVSSGGTGHVESVEVRFDPAVVTYEQLLEVYWHNVDPFSGRGQFCDFGEQYRPVIWVHTAAQRAAADASKARMARAFKRPIAVTIEAAVRFFPAEEEHQDFHARSSVRYSYYRWGCGRDARLAEIWKSATY